MQKFKRDSMIVPAFIYGKEEDFEQECLQQLINISSLPFAKYHTVLLSDGHTGYGMPIGGILACDKNIIVPNAVGVDIGCGVRAIKTDIKDISTEDLTAICTKIRRRVPVGYRHHSSKQEWDGFDKAPCIDIIIEELDRSTKQLGTLGGGNHFIELQKDEDDFIWIMVHSGSRNFGFRIANEYAKMANIFCSKWYSNIPKAGGAKGLAFLPLDTKEGHEYKRSMHYACEFAKENRRRIVYATLEVIAEQLKNTVDCLEVYDVAHNYAVREEHYNKTVVVHRKGAIRIDYQTFGIIPGSQGTASYIVEGLGNPDSFFSCSHGAGRVMSRTKAKDNLNLEEVKQKLDEKGVIHSIKKIKDLEEAPEAYKDISKVIEDQEELVTPKVKLTPIAVVKG